MSPRRCRRFPSRESRLELGVKVAGVEPATVPTLSASGEPVLHHPHGYPVRPATVPTLSASGETCLTLGAFHDHAARDGADAFRVGRAATLERKCPMSKPPATVPTLSASGEVGGRQGTGRTDAARDGADAFRVGRAADRLVTLPAGIPPATVPTLSASGENGRAGVWFREIAPATVPTLSASGELVSRWTRASRPPDRDGADAFRVGRARRKKPARSSSAPPRRCRRFPRRERAVTAAYRADPRLPRRCRRFPRRESWLAGSGVSYHWGPRRCRRFPRRESRRVEAVIVDPVAPATVPTLSASGEARGSRRAPAYPGPATVPTLSASGEPARGLVL
jgi:hypothetical protein